MRQNDRNRTTFEEYPAPFGAASLRLALVYIAWLALVALGGVLFGL